MINRGGGEWGGGGMAPCASLSNSRVWTRNCAVNDVTYQPFGIKEVGEVGTFSKL